MKFLVSLVIVMCFGLASHANSIKMGKSSVSLDEFKKKFEETKNTLNPPSAEQFLEDFIRYKIAIQEAHKKKLEKHPFMKKRMEQELYKVFIDVELGKLLRNVKVSKNEVAREYRRSPEIRLSHIFIELPPQANRKQMSFVKKRAQSLLKKIKSSKQPFEQLAINFSDDSVSKVLGGDLGYQTRLSTNPKVYNSALKLKKGQISNLIQTPYGFHIVKMTGKKQFKNADKRHIRSLVFEKKKSQIFNRYFSKLKRRYPIKIDQATIKAIREL